MKLTVMRWTHIFPFALLAASILMSGCITSDNNEPANGGDATVTFLQGDQVLLAVTCEVAETEKEREVGLMNRDHLDTDSGMLFVFEPPREVTFWMKDTLIQLDIIFVDTNGTVIGIARADPEPDTPDHLLKRYPSGGAVGWVVEIDQGLSREHNVTAGSRMMISY